MRHTRHLTQLLLAVSALLWLPLSALAVTDFNSDGYDDVWQQIHGVTVAAFPLNGDFDGDGCTNLTESITGTDPRNPRDCVRVGSAFLSGENVVFTSITEIGKLYQLESSSTPNGPTWTNASATITGDGTVKQFTAPRSIGDEQRYYRIRTQDKDTDSDGVSDWAETKTGTNINSPTSPSNASGGAATDGDTLRSLLSITATPIAPDAIEKEGTIGRVRLSRTFGTMPLTLPMQMSGATESTKSSASAGDYNMAGATSTSVTIPNGVVNHDITISPVLDATAEVPEALNFTFILPSVPPSMSTLKAGIQIKDAAPTTTNRKLYVAYLGREAGVPTTATGVATALVEGDNDVAEINLTFSNLSSAQNTAYIRVGAGLEVFRIPNGQVTGQSWSIRAAQFLLTDQATLDALASGNLYVSISSADFASGEIRGNFQPATGSVQDPPIPPAPPTYNTTDYPNLAAGGVTNNPVLDRDIARFLTQATYGPTPESIQEVRDMITAAGNDAIAGYTAWIDKQMNLAQTPSPSLQKLVLAADLEEFILRNNKPITLGNDPQFGGNAFRWNGSAWVADGIYNNNYPFEANRRREWWTLVLNSRDQLRQRMAMALHEIVVISENDATVDAYHLATAGYWDMLASNAFGSYRNILEKVTYSPLMGIYLSHLKNQKKSGAISPDENYAREIMQLFSIGLVLRHLDGSLKLDADTGLPIATYDQEDITELARVMTGMSFSKFHSSVLAPTYPSSSNQNIGALVNNTNFFYGGGHRYWPGSWTSDMRLFNAYHDFLDYTTYTSPTRTLPNGVPSASKILFRDKVQQTVIPIRTINDSNATLDVTDALNALAGNPSAGSYNGHPNTPVFISRLLIQRFTTANPSAGYLYRVANTYKQSKGDLAQVIKAILLDYEARSLSLAASVSYGKPKEPILHFTAMLRGVKAYTDSPLANLASAPINFTATESPQSGPYEAAELNKFPAGTKRFRWFDTEQTLTQSPQRAPSVFNWFLPDYVVPGPLAQAGLFAPELQVATESNVINVVNSHYNFLFTNIPPGTVTNLGRGLDDYFILTQYQTASGSQLSIPPYGRPFDATTNPTGVGYFSAAQFTPGVNQPNSLNNQLDNILPDYTQLTNLYTTAFNQSLIEQYAPNPVPANVTNSTTPQKTAAHHAAALAVLDHCDLLFAAGFLKFSYGGLPPGTPSPRQSIITALSGIGNFTRHPNDANNAFLLNAQGRAKNIVYLVVSSPAGMILK